MKRLAVIIMTLIMLSSAALAETPGFARVKENSANVRGTMTGKVIYRLYEGDTLYILNMEKDKNDDEWAHIECQYRDEGKLVARRGWIKASFLEWGSDLYSDIVDIAASETGFVAVKRDGSVTGNAIIKEKTKNFYKDIESLSGISKVYAYSDGYVAVDADNNITVIGKQPNISLEGKNIIAMDLNDEAAILTDEGVESSLPVEWIYPEEDMADFSAIQDIKFRESSLFALMKDGTVACGEYKSWDHFMIEPSGFPDFEEWENVKSIETGMWKPQNVYFYEVFLGVREDGTVLSHPRRIGLWTDEWENIDSVALAPSYIVGVRTDGTVCAEGRNKTLLEEIRSWQNIVKVCAADNYCVGLRKDGTLVFAGEFDYDK